MYHRSMAGKTSRVPLSMETALQRIIRKTGRKVVECRCATCKAQCRTPCLGTPEDILRILKAGYKERLSPTLWGVGLVTGHLQYAIRMVQARQVNGYCTFFRNGLCELHDAGLKPTEGKLSHHTITRENFKFGHSLSWNVAREWLDGRNEAFIDEIIRLMAK